MDPITISYFRTQDQRESPTAFTYVLVVAQDIETSDLSRSPLQIPYEFCGFGSIGGLGKNPKSGTEHENDGNRELHDKGGEMRGERGGVFDVITP